ncbi:aminotransferase class I/II-fold pyridoxal phosphate-dependent enzyme [Sulfurospirillum arcachonense]|uniref:aminotransferase class I/II-fold pyridoxal phosphate-dependent enzyme n=1 Tax=Sulfurospirillum arcachonense TaxID=57666 RepID=UPI000468AFE2|nr:pyridoxal phosphate-dependent aminotransferase family protein [Sulfurospirillum arcachonense]
MYTNELKAINKSNRYRQRVVYDESLIDLASNDYLGLSTKKQLLKRAVTKVQMFKNHAPKASQVVNGYHQIHKDFEDFLCRQNGFEDAIVAGSGFLANLALIEALPRKGDILVLDEEYHASGILAAKLVDAQVIVFKHNEISSLEDILKNTQYKRAIIAVEGIYSMSGEILNKEIFEVVDKYENTILIVDEAHSSGVLGENFMGVYDLYNIEVKANHIKMGTLGKAYGSYGAYILASSHIIEFLQNRAKALIYATAPSLIDIELAHQGMLYILKNRDKLKKKIQKRQELVKEFFGVDMKGLIFAYEMQSSDAVLTMQKNLIKKGFLVGAIRPPTVEKPILRIIPRVDVKIKDLRKLFEEILS